MQDATLLVEVELLELMADRDYRKTMAEVQDLKEACQQGQLSWEKKAQETKKIIQLLKGFGNQYPDYKNIEIIEFEGREALERLQLFSDELEFEQTSVLAQAGIHLQNYEQAADAYRKYLTKFSIHKVEAERMLKEEIPRLVAEKKERRHRRFRRRSLAVGGAVLAIVIGVGGLYGVKYVQLRSNIQAFKEAVQNKNTLEAKSLAKQIRND